jgi:uncharacterized protein involved in exopolysaccharide biosynthesis
MKALRTTREELDRGVGKLRRCLSFWRRALFALVVTSLVAGPLSVTRPRSYRSETVVLYQERIRSADLTGNGDGASDSARRLGARLREALLSRASLEPLVLDLHLYPRLVEQRGLVDAVDEMRKHITFRAREGDTFEIAFEGTAPEEVQEVTQRLAECILKESAGRRAEQARALKEFVDAESERNKQELKAKEAALASYLAVHPEYKRPPGTEGMSPPPAPTATSELVALEQRASTLEWKLRNASRQPASSAEEPVRLGPRPPESPELIAARKDLADKLARFTDAHPDVVAARVRVRTIEAAQPAVVVRGPSEPHAGAARDETEPWRQQLAALRRQIAAHRAGASPGVSAAAGEGNTGPAPAPAASNGSVAIEVEFRRLQREVNDTRERQRQLDEKQFKASFAASSVMDDRNTQVTVLDPAYRPTHAVSLPRSTLLAGALLLCLVLAILTACISAALDDRIHDRADLEHLDITPVLAVIPRAALPALRRASNDG